MPPKRRQSQKSPLPGEELPPGAKRARGGHSRRTPKHSDLESMQITAPPSVTPDVLPLGQKSSLALSSSQQPLSTQQTSGLSSQQPIGSEQLSSSEHLSGNTNRGSQLVCSSHAISILADSIDFDDYKTQLYYFWGHIFLLVRNLKTKERREIFEATLPEFAQGGEERSRLETEFDACYRLFQKQFIKAVETYGHRWLNSPACQKFCELEIYARYLPLSFPLIFSLILTLYLIVNKSVPNKFPFHLSQRPDKTYCNLKSARALNGIIGARLTFGHFACRLSRHALRRPSILGGF